MDETRPGQEPADRQRRLDALFNEALTLPAAERRRFLEQACGGDEDLRREIEALLAASEVEDTLLKPGGAASPGLLRSLIAPEKELLGRTIGRYRILEEIGRGGMGVVYLAERADGQFDQRVALKVLLVPSDPAAIDRFGRERQILANLEHPKIARLIDGGVTEGNQPYLVMEYVDGLPIDHACRQRRIDLRRRITLLMDVCGAVDAAHRQLVVHRDLKPSNILVREDGQVRLLDFGIAKLLDPRQVQQTQTSERFLTPQYASPEQVRGGRITVASDVYQLGLLAYELLAGRRPYELAGLSAAAAERQVCEEMPSKPSTVSRALLDENLRDEKESAGVSYRPDPRLLAGDLDLILLKALHKEPERRYGSVEAFRSDLERYLGGLPISARPDVWTYRLRKFAGRHRWALTAALATLVTLGLLVTAFVIRLAHERDQTRLEAQRAEQRQKETEEVTSFLVGLFESSSPFRSNLAPSSGTVGPETTAREFLDQGRQRLDGALPDQPLVHARLLQAVGRIYRNLDLFDEARPLLEQALERRQAAPGDHAAEIAESLSDLGSLAAQSGREEEAEAYFRESLARFVAVYGERHTEVTRAKGNLANLLFRMRQYPESEALLTSAVAISEGLEKADELRLAWLLDLLARSRLQAGKASEADELFERSIEIRRRKLGPDDYWVGRSVGSLARSHMLQGRHEEAIPLYREGLRIVEARLGPDSRRVAWFLDNLAQSLHLAGQGKESQAMMERALAIHRRALGGKESSESARLLYNLAFLKLSHGDAVGAEEAFRSLRPIQEQLFDGPTEQSAMTWSGIGDALVAQGRDAEAESYFRQSEEELEALFGPEARRSATPLFSRGKVARRRGDLAAAESLVRRAYEILRVHLDPESDHLLEVREELVEVLRAQGKDAAADALEAEAAAAPAAATAGS